MVSLLVLVQSFEVRVLDNELKFLYNVFIRRICYSKYSQLYRVEAIKSEPLEDKGIKKEKVINFCLLSSVLEHDPCNVDTSVGFTQGAPF